MRAPDSDAQQWVTTVARSGLRIERPCWAGSFTRRLTHRLALSGPPDVGAAELMVHDAGHVQWCSVRTSGETVVVAESEQISTDDKEAPVMMIDFASGAEQFIQGPAAARDGLGRALSCPLELDWAIELDELWRQHGKNPGMPGAIDVRDNHGRRHLVGSGNTTFEIYADEAVLGRVFSGDMLFDEALFSHLLRIVGGLAEVSALIGATMREAYGGYEI